MNTKNKLFADFLKIDTAFNDEFSINPMTRYGCWEVMKYQHDWSWLMVVVKEIETLLYNMNYERIGGDLSVEAFFDLDIEGFDYTAERGLLVGTDIDVIYNGCLTFINWYNKNK